MNEFHLVPFAMVILVVQHGVVFLGLGLTWLLWRAPSERVTAGITALSSAIDVGLVGLLTAELVRTDAQSVSASLGTWFSVGTHGFELPFVVDRLSLPLLIMTVLLVGVIGAFSKNYLHRDPGFFRFFLLLHLFAAGCIVIFLADSLDVIVCGWEAVGVTSVFLISFFEDRTGPVRSALRVFSIYRISDIGLLVAVVALHHFADTDQLSSVFGGDWPAQTTTLTTKASVLVGGLLLFAAMGKAAQVPWSGWLPRAMEGPTPSSAIFYGALSVHAGAYLLLRIEPLLHQAPILAGAVVVVGAVSAVHGTMVGRAASDVKTSLAYASVAQLGVIFVEIGLGLFWLALVHIVGHAAVRTLQLLRAPSMLHDHHRMHAASGGRFVRTGVHFEKLLPPRFQRWLYRLALDRGHHDHVIDRVVVAPMMALSRALFDVERRLIGVFSRPDPASSETPSAPTVRDERDHDV